MSIGIEKFNSNFLIKCFAIVCIILSPTIKVFAFNGGNGSKGNPYQISTIDQLQAMQDSLDAHYVLLNDIDASVTAGWNDSAGFDPIGEDPENDTAFTGSFDGQDFMIRNLTIKRPCEYYVGLFGYIYSAQITNVGLDSIIVLLQE